MACAGLAALVLAVAGTAGCSLQMSEVRTEPGTAATPWEPWTPPASAAEPVPPSPPEAGPAGSPPAAGIPPDLLASARNLGLVDLVDLALRNSPDTRAAWAAARSAAADLGSRRGDYYPTIEADINASRVKGSAVGGQFTFHSTSYNPHVTLSYTLLDFGARRSSVEEARQALIAADWTHNAAIQDLVLKVEQAYHQYLAAMALEEAQQAAIKEAGASLDAAEQRRRAGAGTIAEVLQAKTALSQARLALQTVQGQIQIIHGLVATAVGLPANAAFDIEIPKNDLPLQQVSEEIERLIEKAQEERPDLGAARALALKARAHTRNVDAEDRPVLTTTLDGGRIVYSPDSVHQDTYNAGLLLRIPVFNGLTYRYNLFKAREDEELSKANLESLRQRVIFQVWTSYYNVKTAAQRVETSRDLLDSASQSFEVATARYKAGVGSILDLLTAETALQNARAQQVQARTDWFLSAAALAHDTGTLWRAGGGEAKGTP